jgi:hypothetical protein
MARKTRQVEVRMVAEYLKAQYSKFEYIISQPLGVVDQALLAKYGYEKGMGIQRPRRPSVDAVVILPRYLVIVEAKVWSVVNGLGKLPLYKSLVPLTPELKQYQPREVLMELVVGWTNPNLEVMARDAGVTIRIFCPAWLGEVVESMHRYWTPEYRIAREDKLRNRELLGLE